MAGSTGYAAGSAVVVRDEEWLVSSCEPVGGGWKVRCVGASELVRGTTGTFYTELDEVEALDPTQTRLVPDESPRFRRSRLWVEAMLRKTPVPLHEQGLAVSEDMLLDPLTYQRRAVATALDPEKLRPRLLLADAVGLGKTLEIGMILAELARRGRADRILVVTPRHVLEQMQYELWTRFALPLVRLDSDGIARVRQELPASRNPFTRYPRVIVSIDTLKSSRYRTHLEEHRWDAVVIDESHNLTGSTTQNNKLARVLAPNTEALILASATPHNGDPRSFASLVDLLDPTAIVDRDDYSLASTERLFLRRHRHSSDVALEVGHSWAERPPPQPITVAATPAEDALATELSRTWLYPDSGRSPVAGSGRSLFPWTLAKAFLSSCDALVETIESRRRTLAGRDDADAELSALQRLADLAADCAESSKLDALVAHLRAIGVARGGDTRVVLFTERLATQRWLRRRLPALLGLPETAFADLHGGLPDREQQRVVEQFQLASSPLRVVVAGDVASEGVNLHHQCHHLVHVDLPWSLIRIEQRNGRIDRYGQKHPPVIRALALTCSDKAFTGDVRVLTRLLEKEHAAHRALGDAASLLGLHVADREEETIRRALADRLPIDDVVPDPQPPGDDDFDSWDVAFAAIGEEAPAAPEVAEKTTLFGTELDFLRAAMEEAFDGNPGAAPSRGGVGWQEHPEYGLAEFAPPKDLRARLRALPQSYRAERKVDEILMLATTKEAGTRYLREARQGSTSTILWPAAHFLGPLHPVLDWAADRALSQMARGEAPVVGADVDAPTAIMLGTLSNHRGQIVLRALVGLEFGPPGVPPVVEQDVPDLLQRAGLTDHGSNVGVPGDLVAAQTMVPRAVAEMRDYMAQQKELRRDTMAAPLREAARRLRSWRTRTLALAETKPARDAARLRENVERFGRQAEDLSRSLSARPEPMVALLMMIVPKEAS